MKTAKEWLKPIDDAVVAYLPISDLFCLEVVVLQIQDDAMIAARSEADAEWKSQVERLTREVIILRGYIDRLYAVADEAKTAAIEF